MGEKAGRGEWGGGGGLGRRNLKIGGLGSIGGLHKLGGIMNSLPTVH